MTVKLPKKIEVRTLTKEEELKSMFKSGEQVQCEGQTTFGHEPVRHPWRPKVVERVDNWQPLDTFVCKCCMYWISYRCRRHSPAGQEGWPATYPTDHCGDHKMSKIQMEQIAISKR